MKYSLQRHSTFNRNIALLLIAIMAMWSLGLPFWMPSAEAANVRVFSDTLSDSDRGVDAVHTVEFLTTSAMAAGESVRIYFDPTGQLFDFTSVTLGDIASSTTHTIYTGSGSCSAGDEFYTSAIDVVNDYVEYTLCLTSGGIAASTTIDFVVGSSTANMINNPDPGAGNPTSYVISMTGGTFADTGDTRVAIIDDVVVTAVVETTLTFTIAGLATTTDVNGEATTVGTTATLIPFQVLTAGTPAVAGQELQVGTNATYGFSVTVEADQNLTSSSGADIDTFIDGASTAVPVVWASPTGTFGNENEYGHEGITSEDATLIGGDTFGANLWAGDFVGNAREVYYHNGPAEAGTTAGIGVTQVGYQVEVDPLQEAGNDYTQTLTYVATPVF